MPKKATPKPNAVKVETVGGVEGPSLYVDDHRVAGNKPWGGGRLLHAFQADADLMLAAIRRAIGPKAFAEKCAALEKEE
jgi:hypothetical protein